MRRSVRWTIGVAVALGTALLIGSFAAAFFAEEPLRRWFVREINEPLEGYTIELGALRLHLLTVSLSLEDLAVTQDASPELPIVAIERIDGTLDWSALLSGARVVRVRVERPIVRVDLARLRREADDGTPVAEKGWQEAFYNVSPLEVNEVRVVDGALTYLDGPEATPIRVEKLNLRATNIRNVRSVPGDLPSAIRIDARLLGDAVLQVEGAVDFLATPRPRGRVDFSLVDARLDRIGPVAHHAGMRIRGGVLAASGRLESAPTGTSVSLRRVTLDGLEADYVESPAPPSPVERAVEDAGQTAAKKATTASSDSQVRVVIDSFEVEAANLGFVNNTVDPSYRLFVDVASASLRDFSNGKRRKDATLRLDGTFMDSGTLALRGKIRPDHEGPGLDFDLELKDVEIKTLNEALRAHGRLDVVSGRLSVYSEVTVRDREVRGYVKPILVDLEVYDPAQDRDKSLLNRIYQGTVGAVVGLLENEKTDQVATVTPIAGRIGAVDADGWRAFLLLLRNAFVEAVQAGLEHEHER